MAHNPGHARGGRGNSIPRHVDTPATNHKENIPPSKVRRGVSRDSPDMPQDGHTYGLQSSKAADPEKSSPSSPAPRNPRTTHPDPRRSKRLSGKECGPRKALLEPPVTKATLSELDVNKIVHNPKLRHDVNFDPDLCFRPNIDGDKGQKKLVKAERFWDALDKQLGTFVSDPEAFEKEHREMEWCLPATLKAVRSILETLVPQRDRASVEETFNVDLLMQQFRMGVTDLARLASWLARLLKCHCAPMRDSDVDQMVVILSAGEREGKISLLTNGMSKILAILEHMKLDVANHQIRCLRPLLIEDTVHFEQKFFLKKIAMGKFDVIAAHHWYKRAARQGETTDCSLRGKNMWYLIEALVEFILPFSLNENLPHTFAFDQDRLMRLRSDILDLVNLQVCMYLYRSLEKHSRLQEARLMMMLDDTPSSSLLLSPADEGRFVSTSLPSGRDLRSHSCFSADTYMRLARAAIDGEETLKGSASSPSSASPTPQMSSLTPCCASTSDCASQVRSSLRAILASSTSSDRWTSLSSSLALEVLRATPTPLTKLPQLESHLAFHLSNPVSHVYQDAESHVRSQLLPIIEQRTAAYLPLTMLQIFESATSRRVASGAGRTDLLICSEKEELADIATRVAHISILHWKVWAPLAYMVDPEIEDHNSIFTGSDSDMY